MFFCLSSIPYCLVVRIPGSHPGGPGSIPGMGNLFSLSKSNYLVINYQISLEIFHLVQKKIFLKNACKKVTWSYHNLLPVGYA